MKLLFRMKKDQLRSVSDILGLPSTGRHDEHAQRILDFLMQPVDEGKNIPERKTSMRSSTRISSNSKGSIPINYNEDDFDEKVRRNFPKKNRMNKLLFVFRMVMMMMIKKNFFMKKKTKMTIQKQMMIILAVMKKVV